MVNILGFFGSDELADMAKDRDYWHSLFVSSNESIERIQIAHNELKRINAQQKSKVEELKLALEEKTIWADHLEVTNKELTLKIKGLTSEYDALLAELKTTELAHNEATVAITQAKLATKQQRTAIRIAIDNFNLATKDI